MIRNSLLSPNLNVYIQKNSFFVQNQLYIFIRILGKRWIPFHSLNIVLCIWIRCQHCQLSVFRENLSIIVHPTLLVISVGFWTKSSLWICDGVSHCFSYCEREARAYLWCPPLHVMTSDGGGGVPRSDVQAGGTYHVTYPMMHVMYISCCGQNDGHTPVKTLPSSNFVTCADYKQTFRGCSHDAIATYCI